MPTLVKDLRIVPDDWTRIEPGTAPEALPGRAILSFEDWLERRAALPAGVRAGVWVEGETDAE